METGTEIILQRMKDCPEEFPNEGELYGKWGRLIHDARNVLPKEDIEALDASYKRLLLDRFNENVLKALAGEVEPEMIKYKAEGRYATGWSDPRVFVGSSITATLQDNAIQNNQNVVITSSPYEQNPAWK